MPRHGPFLHHRFPANTRSAWRCPDCKSMLQEIHRFPPDYSSRTRYETEKASRPSDHAQHHSAVDLEKEPFQNSLVQRSHHGVTALRTSTNQVCETSVSS